MMRLHACSLGVCMRYLVATMHVLLPASSILLALMYQIKAMYFILSTKLYLNDGVNQFRKVFVCMEIFFLSHSFNFGPHLTDHGGLKVWFSRSHNKPEKTQS